MTKKITQRVRRQLLENAISEFYGEDGIQKADTNQKAYEEIVVELLEVNKLTEDTVELVEFGSGLAYSPVVVPEGLRPLLRLQDSFLMTIGYDGQAWQILDMGQPYWPMSWR
jgi:hypothetical protein